MNPRIQVVDVPAGATTEETERLLNDVCEQGYYVLAVLPVNHGGSRAYFNQRKHVPGKTARGNPGNRDGKDEAALAIVEAHPKASIREVVELLNGAGIKRGRSWVQERRLRISEPVTRRENG